MRLSIGHANFRALMMISAGILAASAPLPVHGQADRGFDYRIAATATGDELSRQPGIWMMEIEFKTLRMITVDVTDPVTGETSKTRVTYLVYRAWNKNLGQEPNVDAPVNEFDPPRGPDIFMPEFTLVTSDNDRQEIYVDEIIPEAQLAISKRERQKLSNSIELIQPLPEAVDENGRPLDLIYGVAMWKNVDPQADRFTVYMTGFSNSYQVIEGPDGEDLILKRTVRQRYWRPGDEIDLFEKEIRTEGEAEWIYRAIDGSLEQSIAAPVLDGDENNTEEDAESTDESEPEPEPESESESDSDSPTSDDEGN